MKTFFSLSDINIIKMSEMDYLPKGNEDRYMPASSLIAQSRPKWTICRKAMKTKFPFINVYSSAWSEMDYLPKGNEDAAMYFATIVFASSEMDYLPKGNEDVTTLWRLVNSWVVRNGLFAERQ